MDGYETDDILSQALDLAEESEEEQIFITQNTFQSETDAAADNMDVPSDVIDTFQLVEEPQGETKELEKTTFKDAATRNMDEPSNEFGIFQLLEEPQRKSKDLEETTSKGTTESNRFKKIGDNEVDSQSKPFVPYNTVKKANWAKNMYDSWRLNELSTADGDERHIFAKDILHLTDDEITTMFSKFIMSARKKDCTEYKSDTIFSIVTALQKYYEIDGRNISLLSNPKFENLRNCGSNTMRQKVEKGIGLFKKKADVITGDKEDILWEKGFLGSDDPDALLRTLFFG